MYNIGIRSEISIYIYMRQERKMDCTFNTELGKFNYRVGLFILNGRKALMVRIRIGLPPSSRNCLGNSAPNRVPLPPATIIAIVLISLYFSDRKVNEKFGEYKKGTLSAVA